MTLKSLTQRVHLWAGLFLGIQVLLWMLSGVVMSWFPIELVRGEVSAYSAPDIPLDAQTYASPGGIIAQAEGATSIELRRFMGKPVYLARGENGATGIYDASSGERISPLNEARVRKIAKQDYVGEGNIVHAALMSYPPHEYRAERPVWRVDFDDKYHTRLYILPNTGQVRSRRNDIWRLYDFFWMLHIMDYDEREDFNNPLIMVASLTGFIFALSGVIIVFYRLGRGRYKNDLSLLTKKHPQKNRDADDKNIDSIS